MRILIKNGRCIDPSRKIDGAGDILVSGGIIERCGASPGKVDRTIDAGGRIVAPGLIDLHAHLREPGREDKETVRTGTRAAVRGAFTTVFAMPNTEPPLDTPERIKAVVEIAARDALARVCIIGAITAGRAGKELTDIAGLKAAGATAVSDDGSPVGDKGLLARALTAARQVGVLLIEHAEDQRLAAGGVMHKGFMATKMGLRGIPAESEYQAISADIEVARKTGAPIHIAHVSCKESVEIIRAAKKKGVQVTAETAPHYLILTDTCCATYDTNTKMNPPLREAEDVAALKAGLADGTIDAIATDHAPHTDSEKDVEFDQAPFGVIGLETALSIAVMELVETKVLTWSGLIEKMSTNPARIAGISGGTLAEGAPADIVIIDPAKEYLYAKGSIESKAKNSPFIGWRLKAAATHVIVAGRVVVDDGRIVSS